MVKVARSPCFSLVEISFRYNPKHINALFKIPMNLCTLMLALNHVKKLCLCHGCIDLKLWYFEKYVAKKVKLCCLFHFPNVMCFLKFQINILMYFFFDCIHMNILCINHGWLYFSIKSNIIPIVSNRNLMDCTMFIA